MAASFMALTAPNQRIPRVTFRLGRRLHQRGARSQGRFVREALGRSLDPGHCLSGWAYHCIAYTYSHLSSLLRTGGNTVAARQRHTRQGAPGQSLTNPCITREICEYVGHTGQDWGTDRPPLRHGALGTHPNPTGLRRCPSSCHAG